MPKVKKIRQKKTRQEPLGQVIDHDTNRGKYAAPIRGKSRSTSTNNNDEEYLDDKTTSKIMKLTQELEFDNDEYNNRRRRQNEAEKLKLDDDSDDDDEVEEEIVINEEDDGDYISNNNGYIDIDENKMGLSSDDQAIIDSMMTNRDDATEERQTLADIILSKIAEKEAQQQQQHNDDDDDELPPLPQKVVDVYTDIGKILTKYTSGKLPKAFKVIPSLSNWEQILYLTRPDLWTPQAMYAATRIFASNLNPKMAQRFYNLVLLDAVRTDIYENKKLNYHYYMSLKKAIYKPAAFFKGILLPLCNFHQYNTTLREAAIIASVLQRVSIPVHHSAVAIHKLAQIKEYNGVTSIFIRTLLNKKYSLPTPVIQSVIRHFLSFLSYNKQTVMPVLWHQSLLVFVQRYKNELQTTQLREAFRALMKQHFHHKITPEIRRELFGLQAYKDERNQMMMSAVGGSTDSKNDNDASMAT